MSQSEKIHPLRPVNDSLNAWLQLGRELGKNPPGASTTKRIALLSGYTLGYLPPLLRVGLARWKLSAEFFESTYGDFEAIVARKDEDLAKFSPELCYLFVGSHHLSGAGNEAERWISLCEQLHSWLDCEVVLNTFNPPLAPVFGNFELRAPESETRKILKLNLELGERLPPYVHLHDVRPFASEISDERLYALSKNPLSHEVFTRYARNLSNVLAAAFGKSKKCLVLDLDNTLWGGVIGEDGMSGIRLGPDGGTGEMFSRFQAYLRRLKERGVLLAVCSKNDEALALEVFEKHPGMILKREDIACFVANWENKDENIRSIAERMNLGLESFVFVDDNPAERAIVRMNVPEVEVLDLPPDPSLFVETLAREGWFETVRLTEEDRERTLQYRQNEDRARLRSRTGNYQEYLRGLEMQAILSAFDETQLPRIAQLFGKTNQFNLTTKRYTHSELESWSREKITRYVRLRDRFGDNGLISAVLASVEGDALVIDSWIMSCRVLKRDVEILLFQDLVREALARGVSRIVGYYRPTDKNGLVRDHYRKLGFREEAQGTWVLDISAPDVVEEWLRKEVPIEIIQ